MIKRYQAKTKFINKYGLEKFLTFSNVVCDHQHDIIAARYPFKSFKKEVVA